VTKTTTIAGWAVHHSESDVYCHCKLAIKGTIQMKHKRGDRSGLSRLEVGLAVLLCALIAQLAFPAFQYARDRARLSQCQSRLGQIGLALANYHERFGVLPPAATWGSEGLDLASLNSHRDPTPVHVTRQNWVQLLLPDLDQAPLARSFNAEPPISDEQNRIPRTAILPILSCASDPYNRADNFYKMPLPDGSYAEFSRGNVAINGGTEYVPASFGTLSNPGPSHSDYSYNEDSREFRFSGSGVAGINQCYSFDDFRNGLSTLVAIEEVRAGLSPTDTRGVWALGQIGASITWGHGVIGDDDAPNATEKHTGADDIRQGKLLNEQLGKDFVDEEKMQVCDHCDENTQATARSKHAGGVNVATLDGAVRFVSDRIEPTLWHVMHSRETPASLFRETFDSELDGPKWTEDSRILQKSADTTAREIENSIEMRFVRVPKGDFVMGVSDKDIRLPYPSDAVLHPVTISQDFFLGIHEVSQLQYETIMGQNPSVHVAGKDTLVVPVTGGFSNHPVENVSWDDAVEFCRLLSEQEAEMKSHRRYRLPTEAEWEYACRAGDREPIPADNRWKEDDTSGVIANKVDPGFKLETVPVGSYPANAFGLFDMCGNVFEWVSDFRAQGYYEKSRRIDPQGPSSGYLHVVRGWHWVATGPACKVYVANEPWIGSPFIGFRVVCEHF